MSLPESMQYDGANAVVVPSKTRLGRFDSTSSSYTSESNNKIIIPVAADGFISTEDSYLFMNITNNSTTQPATLEGNIACTIAKIEIAVQGSSGKVETMDRYSIYHLYDELWNMNDSELNFLNATAGGCVMQARPLGWTPVGDALAAAGGSASWALKLKAGFLTSVFGKALPQGLPQFQIEITLNTADVALTHTANAAARTYTVNNVRWYAPISRISDESLNAQYQARLKSTTTSWVGKCVGTIINNTAAGASTQSFQLNPAYRSLNALVTVQRLASSISTYTANCNTAMNLTGVTSFQYRLNGVQTPSDGIDFTAATNVSRAYIEASKANAPHGKAYAKNSTITQLRFGAANAIGSGSGSGCMAVALKRFGDDPQLVFQGLDTAKNSAPSTLQLTYDGNGVVSDLSTMAYYDCMWTLSPDGMVVAFY